MKNISSSLQKYLVIRQLTTLHTLVSMYSCYEMHHTILMYLLLETFLMFLRLGETEWMENLQFTIYKTYKCYMSPLSAI